MEYYHFHVCIALSLLYWIILMILINLILNMNVWLVQKRRSTRSTTWKKWSKYPTIGSQRIYSRADAWGWCAEMCIEGRLRGVSAVQCCWYCAVQCVVQWVRPLLHSLPPGKPLMCPAHLHHLRREQPNTRLIVNLDFFHKSTLNPSTSDVEKGLSTETGEGTSIVLQMELSQKYRSTDNRRNQK